ncbi:MAG TPA: pyridoxamine 5'-phosphate oxidase family protein [Candidatus Saccharimonadales bacterium]|nr:pyridoxamine 5'-phosphate oxidase family protein [Candidatus Saccharimonadales bacterium]
MTKGDILEFLKSHNLAVVATVDGDKPQAAVVEFGQLDDLTVIIDTLKTSRKYQNWRANPKTAVVIGWDEDKTLQLDGMATELSGAELERAKQAYFTKNPRAKKWADRPEIAYFAIKPSWLRYSDVSKRPWQIEEFKF